MISLERLNDFENEQFIEAVERFDGSSCVFEGRNCGFRYLDVVGGITINLVVEFVLSC